MDRHRRRFWRPSRRHRSVGGRRPYARIGSRSSLRMWDPVVAAGHTYRYRVRGIDVAGFVGARAYSPTTRIRGLAIELIDTLRRIMDVIHFDGLVGRHRAEQLEGLHPDYTFHGSIHHSDRVRGRRPRQGERICRWCAEGHCRPACRLDPQATRRVVGQLHDPGDAPGHDTRLGHVRPPSCRHRRLHRRPLTAGPDRRPSLAIAHHDDSPPMARRARSCNWYTRWYQAARGDRRGWPRTAGSRRRPGAVPVVRTGKAVSGRSRRSGMVPITPRAHAT